MLTTCWEDKTEKENNLQIWLLRTNQRFQRLYNPKFGHKQQSTRQSKTENLIAFNNFR